MLYMPAVRAVAVTWAHPSVLVSATDMFMLGVVLAEALIGVMYVAEACTARG
jgi:hypothetical protein